MQREQMTDWMNEWMNEWMNGNLPSAEEESRHVDMQNSSKQLAQKKRRASEVSCRTLARLQRRKNGDILGQCAASKCQHNWWEKKNNTTSRISCSGTSEHARQCTITSEGLTARLCFLDSAHTQIGKPICLACHAVPDSILPVCLYVCDFN